MITIPDTNFLRLCFENHQSVSELSPCNIPYIDLTYCISGEMHYLFEGEDVYLKKGDAILFPQGSVRQRIATNSPAFYCSFNVTHSKEFVPTIKGYLPKSVRSDTIMILESVNTTFKSVSDEKYAKCTALFWYLYYQAVESAANNEHPHIKRIKQYIAEHLTEQMTLKDIAQSVHLVPHYCCSLFSKQIGQTIFEFISAQRIEMAKSLIKTTNMSLTEISDVCGFSDYNYFSRKFKKFTGMSAMKYKKSSD